MYSLANAIIEEQIDLVNEMISSGVSVNQIDEYGFTPLIEAAIVDNVEIATLLIESGADVNVPDTTGGTALHWATENNNVSFCELLLNQGADPNSYNFSGQPVLVMPLLRQQNAIKRLLLSAGADLDFAQDYVNAKFLGHLFELVGTADIVDPHNQFVEVNFEGFFLEFSLAMIADSLAQFKNHFAGRQLRHYLEHTQIIVDVMARAARLMTFQQYRTDHSKHKSLIRSLIQIEPLIIPVGYEGHAITFIKLGNILVKCDRREESRLYDNIVFYQMNFPDKLSVEFIEKIIFEKKSDEFVNHDLPFYLGLQPLTELKVPAQISGNCSWANVEACIPALFFLLFSQAEHFQQNVPHYKNLALHFFQQWRDWSKDRALQFCIKSFYAVDSIRKACKAEILAGILFQGCKEDNFKDKERIEMILQLLTDKRYEYILQNYIKSYCYEDISEEGRNFLAMLKNFGYQGR